MAEITRTPTREIEQASHPWGQPETMEALLERIGDAHYVLLGEATHGTHEYYLWRSLITQRLIEDKGFSFIAVEGDWPDCYKLNRYIKHYPDAGKSAHEVLSSYKRWPAWMWANWEIVGLAEWLRQYNESKPLLERVGFYGLDVYSLWDSIKAVIAHLETTNPSLAQEAKQAYACLNPFSDTEDMYNYTNVYASESCEADVIKMHERIKEVAPLYAEDYEAALDVEQNARVIVNAERYYRTMSLGDAPSWNVRDNHMVETLGDLMRRHGPQAKTIVWAHNTHIGDARYTDMARSGMVNIGQLVREEHTEEDAVLIGFGSHHGTVIAGRYWDEPMRVMNVPAARDDSWEGLMHRAKPLDKLIISDEVADFDAFWQVRDHRAIGVVYNPLRERANYVPTLLPQRYDAFIYLDRTTALQPLRTQPAKGHEAPETFPWTT